MQGTQDKLKPSLTPPMILSIHVKVSPSATSNTHGTESTHSALPFDACFFSQVKSNGAAGTCDSFESDKSHLTTSHPLEARSCGDPSSSIDLAGRASPKLNRTDGSTSPSHHDHRTNEQHMAGITVSRIKVEVVDFSKLFDSFILS